MTDKPTTEAPAAKRTGRKRPPKRAPKASAKPGKPGPKPKVQAAPAVVWKGLDDLRPMLVPLGDLFPSPTNAREHGDRDLDYTERLLREYGQREPLQVQVKGDGSLVVRCGNGRLAIMKDRMGWTHCAVARSHDDDTTARRWALEHNRSGELAGWNFPALTLELAEVGSEAFTPAVLGFTAAELTGIDPEPAEVRAKKKRPGAKGLPELPKEPTARLGDVWRLGDHLITCGDSTHPEVRRRLFEAEQVDAVVSDPPYAIYGSSTGLSSSVADDRMVRAFFESVLRAAVDAVPWFGHVYVHCDWRSWPSWWEASREKSLVVKNLLVWDKGTQGLGSMFMNCWEGVGFFVKQPTQNAMKTTERGQRLVRAANILRHDRPRGKDRHHNAAKPVPLLLDLIQAGTDKGGTVADLFLGSGSTLLACEESGRTCYGVEIEPKWIDETVRRWETFTGRTAERVSSAPA